MSYIAGTQGLGGFGVPDGPPRIVCDGCGKVRRIEGFPPAWFMDGKPIPGWRMRRVGEGGCKRIDHCADCRSEAP